MYKIVSTTILGLLFAFSAEAQLEKTIHQTFDIHEKTAISIDLVGDSTLIIPWAGNTILTETKVSLYDASPSILAHFMEKEQRYAIAADTSSQAIVLYSVNKDRKPIRTRSGECLEQVRVRVFVPDNFTKQSETQYMRGN